MIPLTAVDMLEKKVPTHLCPVIHIDDGDFVILTHQMASVPTQILRDPVNELSTFRASTWRYWVDAKRPVFEQETLAIADVVKLSKIVA